ncbi:FAD-dependent oxidoreductase [Ramlibacter sp.]|uniref:FAD-dependent oxidoreductase n=1 Tax=Ramlibacter sp. TaxID=1917967 RepID=UPI002FCA03C3
MKVGIAGAGLLGRLLALRLRAAGHEVHVFDPAAHAEARGAAGWTAAGMLSPVAELECADEAVFRMGLRSLELWPQVLAQLPLPVEFDARGSLLVAHRGDESTARGIVDLLLRKAPAGHAPQQLAPAALRELEPAVQGPPHAWLLPCEGRIHTVQAMQALAAGAAGTHWHWDSPVTAVEPGVLRTAGGDLRFDLVFDVRGTGARPQLPVRGVRGEIFWLHAPGVALQRAVRLLHPRHRVYLVPRAGDIVVVGASEIESEDRSPVSLRSTVELLAAAHSVIPELAEARIVHSESNLRPALPDNLPHLEVRDGLVRINGLFRHGWLIAPALVEQALPEHSA